MRTRSSAGPVRTRAAPRRDCGSRRTGACGGRDIVTPPRRSTRGRANADRRSRPRVGGRSCASRGALARRAGSLAATCARSSRHSQWARIEAIHRNRELLAAYRDARACWREGMRPGSLWAPAVRPGSAGHLIHSAAARRYAAPRASCPRRRGVARRGSAPTHRGIGGPKCGSACRSADGFRPGPPTPTTTMTTTVRSFPGPSPVRPQAVCA